MYKNLLVLHPIVPKESKAKMAPCALLPFQVRLAKVPSEGFLLHFPAATDKVILHNHFAYLECYIYIYIIF